jgi:hypothetical protein
LGQSSIHPYSEHWRSSLEVISGLLAFSIAFNERLDAVEESFENGASSLTALKLLFMPSGKRMVSG